ncbi:MAG: hypothetical protein COA79_26665 [Planctomycetota bacterium]|nr:MAG: hypothetical protein COA79_26665 [Planctomycetota bacterium]
MKHTILLIITLLIFTASCTKQVNNQKQIDLSNLNSILIKIPNKYEVIVEGVNLQRNNLDGYLKRSNIKTGTLIKIQVNPKIEFKVIQGVLKTLHNNKLYKQKFITRE